MNRLVNLVAVIALVLTGGCVDDRNSAQDRSSPKSLGDNPDAKGASGGAKAPGVAPDGNGPNGGPVGQDGVAGGANGDVAGRTPMDMNGSDGSSSTTGSAGTDTMAGSGTDGNDASGASSGSNSSSGNSGSDGPPEMNPEPPPPAGQGRSPCDRFCERMDMCLYGTCPALQEVPLDQACRPWCQRPDEDWLNGSADLTCDEFNQRIYAFSPETRALCTEREPGEDLCDVICDFGEVCGLASQDCRNLCGNIDDGNRLCFAGAAQVEDCQRFFSCFGRLEDDGGGLCENLCNRKAICLFNECAPGTVNGNYTDDCIESCEEDRIGRREAQREFDKTCDEVVAEVRMSNPEIDGRCDNEGNDICEALCDDRVTQCMGVNEAECLADCERWDRANHICIARADDCNEIQACFVSQDVQELCRRSCDKLQGCLEEACPPQLIPAQWTDNCTAGCFEDVPNAQEIERFEGLTCRQVREETIYRGNRELRPLCEGNRDFRPGPDECAAFCDGALGECIIGGRRVCLAACASITRDQYECSLTADGDCPAIDMCLAD